MSNTYDGGPAFPCDADPRVVAQSIAAGMAHPDPQGMSLRDYFAAKAMQAWISTFINDEHPHPGECLASANGVSILSYKMADAMLEARKQK